MENLPIYEDINGYEPLATSPPALPLRIRKSGKQGHGGPCLCIAGQLLEGCRLLPVTTIKSTQTLR